MNNETAVWMKEIINTHFPVEPLNRLLHESIAEKAREDSRWSHLTEYVHRMLGGNHPKIGKMAALTEIFVLSLDMADDLQDADNEDKPWMKVSQDQALNAVLALLFGFVGELEVPDGSRTRGVEFIRRIGKMASQAVNGQQKDIGNLVETEEDYIIMIQEKSASLIQFAFYMGYAWTEIGEETEKKLLELAELLGIVAQLDNDLLDVQRHDLKNDLLYKRKTLPILYLLEYADEDFPLLKQYYQGYASKETLLQQHEALERFIRQSGCLEYGRVIQSMYREKAEALFETIEGAPKWKEKLRGILFPVEVRESSG